MKKKLEPLSPAVALRYIEEARITEELAIPVYSSHIKQTLFWSGIPKNKQDKIISGLKILESDSAKHAKILKILSDNYKKNIK